MVDVSGSLTPVVEKQMASVEPITIRKFVSLMKHKKTTVKSRHQEWASVEPITIRKSVSLMKPKKTTAKLRHQE